MKTIDAILKEMDISVFIEVQKCRTCEKWHQFFYPDGYMEGFCEISNREAMGHYDCEFGRGRIIVEDYDEFPTIPNPACEYW